MENKFCLNCSHEISKNFCANCGQKADTHRITLKHFVAHDLLHGVWHLERGILFTIKHALVRPGKAALDYISGKRIRYYNVFYLCLILIGLDLILSHSGAKGVAETQAHNESSQDVIDFFRNYVKFILLGITPLFALNSKFLFGKLKLNLAEHLIVGGFTMVGILFLSLFWFIISLLQELDLAGPFFDYVLLFFILLTFLFPIWAYANLTWKTYKIPGFIWRMIVFYFLLIVEATAFFVCIIYIFTGSFNMEIN